MFLNSYLHFGIEIYNEIINLIFNWNVCSFSALDHITNRISSTSQIGSLPLDHPVWMFDLSLKFYFVVAQFLFKNKETSNDTSTKR